MLEAYSLSNSSKTHTKDQSSHIFCEQWRLNSATILSSWVPEGSC